MNKSYSGGYTPPSGGRGALNIDWITVSLYLVLVIIGWMNIYSADLTSTSEYYFDINENYGKQLVFIGLSMVLIIVILTIDAKIYEKFSIIYFAFTLLLLIGLLPDIRSLIGVFALSLVLGAV